MRIYTKAGDLAFRTFEFSDSQPHFKLETDDSGFREATIEAPIRTAQELLTVAVAADALFNAGYMVNLDIRYLLGARMDRIISKGEPLTLMVICRMLNSGPFNRIRVLDAHSNVATDFLRAENVLPTAAVHSVIATLKQPVVIIPDKGATDRVSKLITGQNVWYVQGHKERDLGTGRIKSMKFDNLSLVRDAKCLIVDDIIDGGATFVEAAKILREAGAKEVHLFATHAILNKGNKLEGIDTIFTTDSYRDWNKVPFGPTCVPVRMQDMR